MLLPEKTVFRLRGCPGVADEAYLTNALSKALGDITQNDIRVQSLAFGHGLDMTSKTATLMFKKLPAFIQQHSNQNYWRISTDDAQAFHDQQQHLHQAFVLDTHFEGFTPLNDVEDDGNAIECAIFHKLLTFPYGSSSSYLIITC